MIEHNKNLVFVLLLIGIGGLLLLGIGITGNAVMNGYTLGDSCYTSKECQNGKVCCLFYGKEEGICHEPKICNTITKITIEDENTFYAENYFSKETPKDNAYSFETYLGILILMIVGVSLYIIYIKVGKVRKKGLIGHKRKRK